MFLNKSAQISNSTFNNIMTLITLVCNSTASKYEGDDRPMARVVSDDMEQSFLYDAGAQRSYLPYKSFKGTYLVWMQILDRKVMHYLVVLEHVQDNILGINFICEHSLS